MNDTHLHGPLKRRFRQSEMNLMIEQLEKDPNKIPSPSRDEMMEMMMEAVRTMNIDGNSAFKSLFLTNALDGSEDYLVSERIFGLIGDQIIKFRKELMEKEYPGTFNELLKSITPPKGIHRKGRPNTEGSELLDCSGDELHPREYEDEFDMDVDEELSFNTQ